MIESFRAIGLALFVWALLNRCIQAVAIGWGVVRDPRAVSCFWLYPLRDLLGFFIWIASYSGRTIEWRGQTYRLLPGGRIERV